MKASKIMKSEYIQFEKCSEMELAVNAVSSTIQFSPCYSNINFFLVILCNYNAIYAQFHMRISSKNMKDWVET